MRIDYLIHSLQHRKAQYIFTKEGTLETFLGIVITKMDNNFVKLAQLFHIKMIVKFMEWECDTNMITKLTPTPVRNPFFKKILKARNKAIDGDKDWLLG